jgi:hypothetical protein
MDEDESADRDVTREREAMREGAKVALRSMALNLPLGIIVLGALVYGLSGAIAAGHDLFRKGEHWDDSIMPALLFVLFGGCFGCFLGKRMAGASGLTGPVAFGIGMVGLIVLLVCGIAAAAMVFPGAVPALMYASLGAMTVTAGVGLAVFTLWGAG